MGRSQLIHSIDRRHGLLNAFFPLWTWAVRWPLLITAALCAAAVAGLTLLVKSSPYIPLDDSIDRAIQSVNWGPLSAPFPFFSWVGGPGGKYMQGAAILLVLLLNRRAWLLALAATAGGFSYFVLVGFAHRPRPAPDQVLFITEHPGATSFPSGHVIFITISIGLVMLCVGYRYLPSWARPIGWAVVAAVVLLAAISRVYVGAHWPFDVLASMLIAAAWLSLVTSIRWISDRAIDRDAQ